MLANGGEFLLDLTAIILTASNEEISITNIDILSQLLNLKTYIRNNKMIKPIWVKFIDNSGKVVVTRGTMSSPNSLYYKLFVETDASRLNIGVTFKQLKNSNNEYIDDYEINTATLNFDSRPSITKIYKHTITFEISQKTFTLVVNLTTDGDFSDATLFDMFIDSESFISIDRGYASDLDDAKFITGWYFDENSGVITFLCVASDGSHTQYYDVADDITILSDNVFML